MFLFFLHMANICLDNKDFIQEDFVWQRYLPKITFTENCTKS